MAHATLPVRTVIVQKLMDAFAAIDELKTVKAFLAPPVEISNVQFPALYLLEIQAEDRGYANQIATAKMHLMAQVYFKSTMLDSSESQFSDMWLKMDIVAAEIHKVLHTNVGLSKNGLVNIVEIQYDRVLMNDSVGVLQSTFDVEYRHDRGGAYS